MKSLLIFLLAAALCLSLAACGEAKPERPEQEDSYSFDQPAEADPQRAIDEIYASIDMKELQTADDSLMTDTLGFDLTAVSEYYVRYSSGRYGLADTYIVKPTDEGYDKVRETLENIRLDRINSTSSYDVLNSNKIAQNAMIFQYGGYWIMLMLPDNETAMKSIEKYIPSTAMDIIVS